MKRRRLWVVYLPLKLATGVGLVLSLALLAPAQDGKDEPKPADNQRSASALKVYRHLFEKLVRDEMRIEQIETLATWSRRVVAHEFAATGYWEAASYVNGLIPRAGEMGTALEKALKEHRDRMQAVEHVVLARQRAGTAAQVHAEAASYFRMEADAIIARMNQMRHDLEERELAIELPGASAAEPLVKPRELVVRLDKGRITVGGKQLNFDQLKKHIQDQHRRDPIGSLVIRATAETRYESVVRVMDAANRIGIESLSISLEEDNQDNQAFQRNPLPGNE